MQELLLNSSYKFRLFECMSKGRLFVRAAKRNAQTNDPPPVGYRTKKKITFLLKTR